MAADWLAPTIGFCNARANSGGVSIAGGPAVSAVFMRTKIA